MSIAVPAYAAVLILSGGIYFLAVRAMHRPVQIGVEVFLSRTGGRRACSAVSDLDLSGAILPFLQAPIIDGIVACTGMTRCSGRHELGFQGQGMRFISLLRYP